MKERLRNTLTSKNQSGINMVDLMMWLVIAALLLAAALQSIGYYQKAAITYTLKNDAMAVRTYMEKQMALNGTYPENNEVNNAFLTGEIEMSDENYLSGVSSTASVQNWAVRVCSRKLDPNVVGAAVRIVRDAPNHYDYRVCSANLE